MRASFGNLISRSYARQSVGGRREVPQSTHDIARIAPRSGERSYDLCGLVALGSVA